MAEARGYKSVSSLQLDAKVTYPTLRAIWNNTTTNPDFETLAKIAIALRVSVKDLIEEEEETQALAGTI